MEGGAVLPEECWECILSRLDQKRHFEALSLVCKRFLSITNRLRSSLTVSADTIRLSGTVIGLLRRFHQLKRIDIVEFDGDINRLIREIAKSGLHIAALNMSKQRRLPVKSFKKWGSKMKSLRTLVCSELISLRDSDLIAVADSFPSFEELDISCPEDVYVSSEYQNPPSDSLPVVTDAGITAISMKLRSLRKIDLSGNFFITDRSLLALSSNCVYLREIHAHGCTYISQNGIRSVIHQSRNLSSLSLGGYNVSPFFTTVESSSFWGRSLSSLEFSEMEILDSFFYSIREANLPLKKLSLSRCKGFTVIALSSLLSAYQSLNHLDLEETDLLTDESMTDLSQYLYHLNSINLSCCCRLTGSTLFALAKSCPFLETIQMECTELGRERYTRDNLVKNPCIHSLKLSWNRHLSDGTLGKLASVCPKLRLLDVSHCCRITEEGIGKIAERCSETLMELNVTECYHISSLGTASQLSSLEVLQAAESGINDQGLSMVGCRLQRLDLEDCFDVTMKGLMEVVLKCKVLREINLKGCNVRVAILAWMVFSRPSLRKVSVPRDLVLGREEKDLFLRHGCVVS